jgi:hypothetical protein
MQVLMGFPIHIKCDHEALYCLSTGALYYVNCILRQAKSGGRSHVDSLVSCSTAVVAEHRCDIHFHTQGEASMAVVLSLSTACVRETRRPPLFWDTTPRTSDKNTLAVHCPVCSCTAHLVVEECTAQLLHENTQVPQMYMTILASQDPKPHFAWISRQGPHPCTEASSPEEPYSPCCIALPRHT